MPRHVQGLWPAEERGTKGKGKGYNGSHLSTAAALPTQCMGEAGRDYLRRFIQDTSFAQNIARQLDEDGYCVLRKVFTDVEMDVELDRAWSFVERVSPTVRRQDPSTWWAGQGLDPWPHAQRDMMQLHQAGWVFSELRERFAERVFEPLYGTRQLHVSKDGFTFQRPTNGELNRTPNDHFDQGSRWMGLQCVQGSVALTNQAENDGCFKVWPGSHRYREELLSSSRHQGSKAMRSDFIIMSENEMSFLRSQGIEPQRVPVKRGDVILWRSDVAHCGAPPLGRCDSYRVVVYCCCLPAALSPEAVYEQKSRAYERLETGCHYPNREEWFEATDRHKRMPWRPYFSSPPQLSARQRELYGLVRYDAVESPEASSASPAKLNEGAAALPNATATRSGKKDVLPGPVAGLTLSQVSAETARAALVELRPHFKLNSRKGSSSMFEVGWSFHAIEDDGIMRTEHPLSAFPCLRVLLAEAMLAFCGRDDLYEDTINIICRRYIRGQCLAKHIDRPQLFDESVYGCILHNTSDRVLEFQKSSRSGEVLAGPHYMVEEAGACFCQTGEARYDWIHGIEPLGEGERISVTWRWIDQAAAAKGHDAAEAKGLGRGQFGKTGKSQGKGIKGYSKGKAQGIPEDGKRNHTTTDEKDGRHPVSAGEASKAKRWGRR